MAEEERILEVTPDFDGKRIDQCLTASFSDRSGASAGTGRTERGARKHSA